MHVIAAPTSGGAVLGSLGGGGIALALTALLILGVRGGGRIKFGAGKAGVCAFLAGTSYVAAGKIWENAERVVAQGLTGFGVGSDGPFGHVGIGAVALLLLIIMLAAPLGAKSAAVVALIAAFVWPATGDGTIWAIPGQLAAAALMSVGG
ncbi:hypothetical protein I6J39_16845 [Streptomyces californicus]|uniref:Integral membrane protein n=1 Tax=Streptomyces californicus TaxID=67351 RepID=A0ABX7J385_9ACTN|nr:MULTISPECIES: hypothetical protein [Streptomyces]QRV28791.1 hypothetical protein I6J39_16845 [Streptomyces californicus]QRV42205.1 hypothetical protein I6J41_16760 [Streptomyces californicus]